VKEGGGKDTQISNLEKRRRGGQLLCQSEREESLLCRLKDVERGETKTRTVCAGRRHYTKVKGKKKERKDLTTRTHTKNGGREVIGRKGKLHMDSGRLGGQRSDISAGSENKRGGKEKRGTTQDPGNETSRG